MKSIEIRKELTDEWKRHGLQEGLHFAKLTDIIYRAWSDIFSNGRPTAKQRTFESVIIIERAGCYERENQT